MAEQSWKNKMGRVRVEVPIDDLHADTKTFVAHPAISSKCRTFVEVEFQNYGDFLQNGEDLVNDIREQAEKMDKAVQVRKRMVDSMDGDVPTFNGYNDADVECIEVEDRPKKSIRPKKKRSNL
jgi:hypothetical protein